jgi:hypothetical protein
MIHGRGSIVVAIRFDDDTLTFIEVRGASE